VELGSVCQQAGGGGGRTNHDSPTCIFRWDTAKVWDKLTKGDPSTESRHGRSGRGGQIYIEGAPIQLWTTKKK